MTVQCSSSIKAILDPQDLAVEQHINKTTYDFEIIIIHFDVTVL